MNEKNFINEVTKNICLLDKKIALESKGFYYSAYINACNNNSSLNELFRNSNEDQEYVFNLIEELIRNGYLVLGIPMSDGDVFIFNVEKGS